MTTNDIMKAVLAANGWKILSNRKSGRGERYVCVTKDIPYEQSKTKSQQREIVHRLASSLSAEHDAVSSIEWTNEDGGDFNTVEVYIYVIAS